MSDKQSNRALYDAVRSLPPTGVVDYDIAVRPELALGATITPDPKKQRKARYLFGKRVL